jgi:catecholate siderophore receptor
MSPIQRRKHAARPVASSQFPAILPLSAALVAGLALATPLAAAAQDAAHATPAAARGPAADDQIRTLGKVEVVGDAVRRDKLASPKATQTLQDTPQTIEVLGKELLQQQGATTLTEALRNSPGVGTFYAGENGATSTGDTLYMRGFDSSGSIFVDGVRDLGAVSRDLFNIEQVEVVKGPAGTDTGRSAPTGAINMVTRQANLSEGTSASASVGADGQRRGTADINASLGATSALRISALWQDSDVAGRDRVNNSRRGVAPSLGFGLGTGTRVFLNLLYVEQDNVPDGFVPTIGLPSWLPQPGLEQLAGHPVDPENYYGSPLDHDDVTARMATLRIEHDFTPALKLGNTLRWGRTAQDYFITSYTATGGTSGNPQAGNIRWTDRDDLSTYTLQRSNFSTRDQENRILTDQLNLRADFRTGAVAHFLTTGLELTREEQGAHAIATSGSLPPINFYDPEWDDAGTLEYHRSGAVSRGRTDTTAAYLFDTMKFGERFLLSAGLRADHYTTDYDATAVCTTTVPLPRNGVACPAGVANGTVVPSADLHVSGTLLNYKLGAVYKPVEALSLYANAALSQQPPGGANFSLSTAANSADNIDNDPQKARTYEAGAKWAIVPRGATLNLALFRTDVSNEIVADTEAPGGYSQTGRKRVQGVELSLAGSLTPHWDLSLGYLHQDAKVEEGPNLAADGTANLTYTPADAVTSWSTYRFDSGLTLGGGIRYTSGLHKGTDGAVGTPDHTKPWIVYDAVASLPVGDRLTLRLNAYNLFDKRYVAAINKSGYRYTPGTPRTFVLSVDFAF